MTAKDEAEAAIATVAEYLRQQDAGYLPPEGDSYHDDPEHRDDAARWSHKLLAAAKRDGWGGCRLCRA